MTDKTDSKERDAQAAETWLRARYGAYRGHFAWRELEEAFQAGRASLAASAGSEPVAPYSIDADPQGIRSTVADAITGALAFGAQGVNPPPEGHWLAPFWKVAREDKDDVRGKRELRQELQQQCSTWGTYWRGSDAHGVVLSHPQAVELLQNALGVDVEIEVRGCQTCDYTGVIGDVPCPDCAHPSPPEGMVGGWQDIATAPKDGTRIIAYRPSSPPHIECMNWCAYEDADIPGAWHWAYDGDAPRENPPTHWMPLPPPPTTSDGSGKGE